jgi:hypothetical protein
MRQEFQILAEHVVTPLRQYHEQLVSLLSGLRG